MANKRKIEVVINGALPLGGFKAVLNRVDEYEKRIAKGEVLSAIVSTGATPNPPVKQVCTSLSAYEVYVLNLIDFNPTLGKYAFTLVSIGL